MLNKKTTKKIPQIQQKDSENAIISYKKLSSISLSLYSRDNFSQFEAVTTTRTRSGTLGGIGDKMRKIDRKYNSNVRY